MHKVLGATIWGLRGKPAMTGGPLWGLQGNDLGIAGQARNNGGINYFLRQN